MIIFIILLIYKFIKGTFEYEKVTQFELVIIPVYSIIMVLLNLNDMPSITAIGIAIILLLIGTAIEFLQASKTQIKDTGKFDSYNRPILEVKRNLPYLVGWIGSFLIAISIEIFYGSHFNAEEISRELLAEILKGLSVIAFLGGHGTWSVWILNFATSFSYGCCLMIRYPKIKEAIQQKIK